ncbi:MAG: hypothetical protein LBK06_07680 [Planctomycetaceae bacterium]|nr:hypothetical protein [Planctomycetaceae bacterium]
MSLLSLIKSPIRFTLPFQGGRKLAILLTRNRNNVKWLFKGEAYRITGSGYSTSNVASV